MLSQVLVAFVIEFDNEFESRLAKTWARPFRVSMVMWSNFMRFVREGGTPFAEVVDSSHIPSRAVASVVGGMERWSYISVDEDPAGGRPPPRKGFGTAKGIRPDTTIFPSMTGKLAKDIWEPLGAEIEERWSDRLGQDVENLRAALDEVQITPGLPRFLPVVGGDGLFTEIEADASAEDSGDDLPTLLARALLSFTLEYEKSADVSLTIARNVLRVVGEDGIAVKDLPLRTGVAKEAVDLSTRWLVKSGYSSIEPDSNARGKIVRLTPKGVEAQVASARSIEDLERLWDDQSGGAPEDLRSALRSILERPGGEDGPLTAGLVPPDGGWRGTGRYKALTAAFVENPSAALPHQPIVTHRGGWPDGS